jgi:hypothetical protein
MSELKTHWKKLVNPDYLGAYSLQPGEVKTLTIAKVSLQKVIGTGGKKQDCMVVQWQEKEKPMILNRINAKMITKIYGTPHIEDWAGKKVRVYAELVDAFGEQVEALRIKYEQVQLPVLTKEMPAYQNVIKFIVEGGSLADVERKYILTDEIKADLAHDTI